MEYSEKNPIVGIVVIGRNEGERLVRCLRSLEDWMQGVSYVDSGSTDGSVEIARSVGATVVELDRDQPFTAARARNHGVRALLERGDFSLLQFVDGDCEVDPDWISTAAAYLNQHADVVAVAGRLSEKNPERSVYNRLCSIEWNVPTGEARALGGIAMYRTDRFLSAGMFDPSLASGEEPELCSRIRRRGGLLMRIDADMAIHDADIVEYRQWWRRAYKAGYGGLDVVSRMTGKVPVSEIPFLGMVRSAPRWTLYWAAITAGLTGLGAAVSMPHGAWVGLLAGLAIWVAQAARIAWSVRDRTDDWFAGLTYGVFTLIGKWAQLSGQRAFRKDTRSTGTSDESFSD